MKRFAGIVILAAVSGCAAHTAPALAGSNWAVVERFAPGTEVIVRVDGRRHFGQIDTVTADALVLRERSGLTSFARPDIVRLYRRDVFINSRVGNALWDAGMFIVLSAFVVPFVHGNREKVVAIMAASGAAFGALAPKTTYKDRLIYVRP